MVTKQLLTLSTTHGSVQTKVLAEAGGLVVHPNINAAAQDGWAYALSHAESGLHLAAFRSRGEACAAMRAIEPLLPWSAGRAAIVAAATTRDRCKTWGLIRKFGGYCDDNGRAFRSRRLDS